MNMPKLSPLPIQIKEKSTLARIWYWQGFIRQWELLEDWHFQLPYDEVKIVLPKGFTFDGVSIPRPLHWFLSPTGVLFIPGMVHDFAYRYDYLWAIDEDDGFYQYKKDSGRYHWDSMFRYLGLSLNGMKGLNRFARIVLFVFGGFSWKKNRKNQVEEIRPESKNS
ncbi:MAG: hypothetical protein COA44_07400 [Arcobacter sp.]|nr:MAG: hypothetical protein COA44_07400 [Arcobacter sp.]